MISEKNLYLSDQWLMTMLKEGCHFPRKNYSAENGTDGNFDVFRRNSVCFAEQKTFEIPFRTIPRKREKLVILLQTFRTLTTAGKNAASVCLAGFVLIENKFYTLLLYREYIGGGPRFLCCRLICLHPHPPVSLRVKAGFTAKQRD